MRNLSKRVGVLATGLALLAIPAFVTTPEAAAGNGTNVRPISDFLDQQVLLAPGFGAGVDWVSEDEKGNVEYRARIDWVGVINRDQLEGAGIGSLGTKFEGKVTESVQKDGRTLVHVEMRGENVFCLVGRFVQVPGSNPPRYYNPFAPAFRMWGQPAGLVPSQYSIDDLDTVDVHLDLKFLTTDPPGSDLPQVQQLMFFPEEGQEVLQTLIQARGKGRLRSSFGVEDGTPGQLTMTMKGIWNASFDEDATNFRRDPWPVGKINLRAVGN